jgi:hypothetical protein
MTTNYQCKAHYLLLHRTSKVVATAINPSRRHLATTTTTTKLFEMADDADDSTPLSLFPRASKHVCKIECMAFTTVTHHCPSCKKKVHGIFCFHQDFSQRAENNAK